MKRRLHLLWVILLCCICGVYADPVIEDGVYFITCEQGEGYVALGGKHDMLPFICYVNDMSSIAADGYWVVTNTRSGYTFRNEVTDEYLVYTTERWDDYYKWMTLSTDPEDRTQFWNVRDNGDGTVSINSVVAENYYWNLRYSQGLLGTYSSTGTGANERYTFYKKGSEPGPGPGPGPGPDPEPEVMTKFPDALHVYLNDGRIEAYPLEYITSYNVADGQLVIETNVGQTFTYSMSDVQTTSETAPTDFPMFESYKFNNKFNDQLFTDADGEFDADTVNVTIAAIGKRLTPSFKVPDDATLVYVNGVQQESKVTRLRFDKDIYYVVTRAGITMLLPDADGGTYSMQPYGRLVRVHVDWLTDRAEVPTIYINTEDGQGISSKTEFKNATIMIDGHDIFPSMEETPMQIKGRGNSSWGWPKKPYRLKFEEKVKPLGMTKGKSWVLLSNYQTGSLMSNAIGMKAANLMKASAANHIVPVDLYLNGEYRGSYNLTEKVGLANNSVDLEDETAAALLELDSYFDEPANQKFRSVPYNLPINIKEPEFDEGTTSLTLEQIRDDFNAFMTTLYRREDLSQHVDVEQLVRFLMVNELICNFELYHPKSTFCYRESFESDTSKYVFGPVWDLDWAFGYEGHSRYYRDNATSNYWLDNPNMEVVQFIRDLRWNYEPMSDLYKQLWEEFMENDLQELLEYCQDYYDFGHNSFDMNRQVWGDWTDYSQQVGVASNWLETRANKIWEDILNDVRPEKPDPVDPPEPIEFANDKLYTISCRRGDLVLSEDHEGLEAGQSVWWDLTEEEMQFAIITIEGNNYLYSPLLKAYLKADESADGNGHWVEELGSPIYFDDSHPDGEYMYMMSILNDYGGIWYFNNNSRTIVINSWDTPDDGDRWKIEEVGDFDPTEALRIAQGSLFVVTTNLMFDGQVIASESKDMPYGAQLPDPPTDWGNAFVTLKPVGTIPFQVTDNHTVAYEAVWQGPFAFSHSADDAEWYNMTIRTLYYVSVQDSEPYYPAAEEDGRTLAEHQYHWAFVGTPYMVKVYNRSTGFDQVLTKTDVGVVMRPGDYTWELVPNGDGFVLLEEGSMPTTCINQFGGSTGPLSTWTSWNSLTDDGSTFRVTRAQEYDAIDGLNNGQWTKDNVYDLSGRKIAHRPLKPGIYLINGRKVAIN